MSKRINFNARDFRFDDSCATNAGTRMFVTTSFGNAEVFEIGNRQGDFTKIVCDKKLEPNTDYCFRFAVTDVSDDNEDVIFRVEIYPENEWEGRFVYPLECNRYEPVLSKRDKRGFLRVYEIDFNSGDRESYRIDILTIHAMASILPAEENDAYSALSDMTYEQWIAEKNNMIPGKNNLKALSGSSEHSVSAASRTGGISGERGRCDGLNFSVQDTELSEIEFAEKLERIGNGCNISFKNVNVQYDDNKELSLPSSEGCGCNFHFVDVTLTSRAMALILAKMGDGCNGTFDSVTVTSDGLSDMKLPDKKVTGVNITFNNSIMPKAVQELLYGRLGNGCSVADDYLTTL